ncbi:MAG: helix-turn-helix transcriptional regulator, partial [Clostridia bacterium]|nr:helix-turn-helix transcriptional regulator [Clostridia bacterium]
MTFFRGVAQFGSAFGSGPKGRGFESKPEAFVDIVAYIDNHYTENLTSEGISKMFGYNNTYFCKKFKSVTGMTVMNYVKHLRLSKAKKLLSTTND